MGRNRDQFQARRPIALVALAVALLGLLAGPALGQSDETGPPADPGVSSEAPFGGEIELRVLRLGPGGLARRGSWAGVLVELRDRGLRQREIVLRAKLEDRDGDEAWLERVVASNPGFAQSFWLYLRLPHGIGTPVSVTAHEAEEVPVTGEGPPGLAGFQAGRVLARADLGLDRAASATEGLYGVLGTGDLGLRQYASTASGERFSPAGHEVTRVAVGIGVEELPDRWQGLAPVSVLAWGRGTGAGPESLSPDQARALREWVARGGHLVIALPSASAGVWLSPRDNPIHDLLPALGEPVRREGVDLGTYRGLLTIDPLRDLPASEVVQSFRRAEGAGSQAYIPILEGPGGEDLVVRRIVGSGMVTLVGLDVASPALRSAGLPEAEAFWHRVLGRRGALVSGSAGLATRFGPEIERVAVNRDPAVFDADFEEQIDKSRRAAAGVLLGFGVFLVYWLVAGPVGFWLLSKWGLRRHAWVAFAATAVVFTGIAWSGAAYLRPARIETEHLTLLEQVHGQPMQRGRTWASVLVPWYGRAEIAVGSGLEGAGDDPVAEALGLRQWHDLLSPWSPAERTGLVGGFPDNRGYRMDARSPDGAQVPARSTVKPFRFDWAGPPAWSMPTPVGLPGEVSAPELTFRPDGTIDGVLMHGLPAPLEGVVLLWVTGQTDIRAPGARSAGRDLKARVRAVKLVDAWPPGQRLDLLARTSTGEAGATYLEDLLATGRRLGRGLGGSSGGSIDERLVALSLFGQLPPPDLEMDAAVGRAPILATRTEGHAWDLSPWFTQPCLIVLGQIVQSGDPEGGPVPVRVDGRIPEASGRTLVRWIYPMRGSPPGYGGPVPGTPGG